MTTYVPHVTEQMIDEVDLSCDVPDQATSSHRLNFIGPGLPSILAPEEAREHPVEITPLSIETTLTFRVEATADFYVDYITLILWHVVDIGGGVRNLVRVLDDGIGGAGALPADIRLAFTDDAGRRNMQRSQIPWNLLAGDGYRQKYWDVPQVMRGSRTYTCSVRSYEQAETFAISLQMHGRKRRVENPTHGYRLEDDHVLRRLIAQEKAAGTLYRGQLGPDHLRNVYNAGRLKILGLPDPPNTVPVANFDAPSVPILHTLLSERRYNFYCRNIFGRQQIVDGQGVGTPLWIEANSLPIFARVYDNEARYWLTNYRIPMAALCGWAGQPTQLPVDWSWGRNSSITVELVGMDAVNIVSVMMEFQGWYRGAQGLE